MNRLFYFNIALSFDTPHNLKLQKFFVWKLRNEFHTVIPFPILNLITSLRESKKLEEKIVRLQPSFYAVGVGTVILYLHIYRLMCRIYALKEQAFSHISLIFPLLNCVPFVCWIHFIFAVANEIRVFFINRCLNLAT